MGHADRSPLARRAGGAQCTQFILVGAAEQPDEREIDRHAAADERDDADQAMPDRSGEEAAERTDREQGRRPSPRGDQLANDPAGQPALDPEMAAAVEDDVKDDAIEPAADRDRRREAGDPTNGRGMSDEIEDDVGDQDEDRGLDRGRRVLARVEAGVSTLTST